MQETQIQPLGREDPLEEEMTTHSSIPVWEMPGTEEPGGLQSMGSRKSHTQTHTHRHTDTHRHIHTHTHTHTHTQAQLGDGASVGLVAPGPLWG